MRPLPHLPLPSCQPAPGLCHTACTPLERQHRRVPARAGGHTSSHCMRHLQVCVALLCCTFKCCTFKSAWLCCAAPGAYAVARSS